MKSYKIVYIIDNLLIGGAQRHLVRLVNGLQSRNYSVAIISLGPNDRELTKEIGVSTTYFRMDCVWRLYFWKDFIRLIRLLKKEKPFIVHTYLNTSNVFGTFAAKLANIPIIINSRRDMGHFRSGLVGRLERIVVCLSDKVVCVSESVRKKVVNEEKIPFDKTVVIYNGVDIDKLFCKPSTIIDYRLLPKTISMVATMDRKEKGHIYFIKAAEEVIKKIRDVRFVLIGDGPLRHALEDYVSRKRIDNYFDFRGKRTDLLKELHNTDILVVPSESEGCSNALLEAMAMGIVPVATSVEGNIEIIEDGISGLLVKSQDTNNIALGIIRLLKDEAKFKDMSMKARERIKNNFTIGIMLDNFDALYKELITNKGLESDSDRLKISYVVSLFPCWSETFILNEIIELSKNGFNIDIFSIRRDLEEFIHEKARPFIAKTTYINFIFIAPFFLLWFLRKPLIVLSFFQMVLCRKYNRKDIFIKYLWCVFVGCFFAKIALKKEIEHIHAHFATYPAFVAMVVSKLTGIPFTFTTHAHDIFLDKTFFREKVKAAKAVVAISNYNRQYIADYCKDGVDSKIKVIHCGIDISEYSWDERLVENNIIVSVGRLTKMKGFDYLIKACEVIRDRVDFKCLIIGDGPEYRCLSQLIDGYGLKDKVFLKGVMDNSELKDVMREAKVFVLPSVWDEGEGQDGIPIVLMEAMASGIPVISTRISGIPELVEDRKTGILVEPGDARILAEAIIEIMGDTQLRKKLLSNARKKVEMEFNISKSAKLLAEVFTNGYQS